ncbi:MAG: glycosyltransferase family 4 protein [Sulfurimonas sp.]|nr:glycosyltransferase family 4 protein [Sulfurimonas sp.]
MKILITTEQYYPVKSGVSTVVTSIAEELTKIGNEVTVVTGFLNRRAHMHNGVHIVEFKIKGGFGNYYRGEIEEYIEYMLHSDFDIVINECVQTWTTDLILKYLPKIKGKKFLHSHGFSLLSYKTKNPWAYIKSKFYYKNLHNYLKDYEHIFLLHDNTIETPYLKKYAIDNFAYLPNGVDEKFIAEDLKNKNLNTYILNISNYFPMKNQEFLLEAYYKSNTKLKLVLIGSSILKEYLNQLKSLKKKLDIQYGFKNVEFLLELSRDETIKYLENAALFLHSSKLEVFPMVILEAMAKGVPFISTRVGNVENLLGGVVVDDIDEMAFKIDTILQSKENYRRLVSEGIYSIKQNFNWKNIVQILMKKIV